MLSVYRQGLTSGDLMTLPHSAVPDLMDALRAGDGVDLLRESVGIVLQELIDTETAQVIGGGRTNAPRSGPPRATGPGPSC